MSTLPRSNNSGIKLPAADEAVDNSEGTTVEEGTEDEVACVVGVAEAEVEEAEAQRIARDLKQFQIQHAQLSAEKDWMLRWTRASENGQGLNGASWHIPEELGLVSGCGIGVAI